MNMPLPFTLHGRSVDEIAAEPVLAFVAEHHAGLWNAAKLLGGSPNARLVDRLVEELKQARRLTARTRLMLDQLMTLLTLENVHDFERPEAAFFANIDPNDPVVADICELTDGLRVAVDRADADSRRLSRSAAVDRAA